MEIFSELATYEDTSKIVENNSGDDYYDDVINDYHYLLEEYISGDKSREDIIKVFSENYYLMKITFKFDEDVVYYMFYQDNEPGGGIYGIITNSDYEMLVDLDIDYYNNIIFKNDLEISELIGNICHYNVLSVIDKKYLFEIYKLHIKYYMTDSEEYSGEDSEENIYEYYKIFTLYEKNIEKNGWYKIYENNNRINNLFKELQK
jgi:hypothetical protein